MTKREVNNLIMNDIKWFEEKRKNKIMAGNILPNMKATTKNYYEKMSKLSTFKPSIFYEASTSCNMKKDSIVADYCNVNNTMFIRVFFSVYQNDTDLFPIIKIRYYKF